MLKCFDLIVSPFSIGFLFLCPLIGHQHKITKGVYRAIEEPMKNIMQMIDPCSRLKVVKNSLRLVFCINLRIRSAEDLSWKYQLLPWIPLRWRKPLQRLILRLFFVGFAQCLQFIEIFSLFYLHFKRVQFGIRPRQSCVMSKATCFLLTPERNKTLLNKPHM